MERLRGHIECVSGVAFTSNGRGLVSGSLDKTLKSWDLSYFVSGPGGLQTPPGASGGGHLNRVKEVGGRSVFSVNFAGTEVCVDAKEANLRCLISV